MLKTNTLCWNCKNAIFGCSWSREFIPVPGWEAVETSLRLHKKPEDECTSYIVLKCPEFQPEKPRANRRRKGV